VIRLSILPAIHIALIVGCISGSAITQGADIGMRSGQKVFAHNSEAIVAVRYVLKTELRQEETIVCGVVVSADGLVMVPMSAVSDRFPDDQMQDFKIRIPREDGIPFELDALFQGRDPRYDVAFVKAKAAKNLVAATFEDMQPEIGETVYSIGMMPSRAGLRRYLMDAMVAGNIPGEVDNVLVDGRGLATVGSPVFDADGHAIGFVTQQPPMPLLLNDSNSMAAILTPPKFYTPTAAFLPALQHPPTPGHPIRLPWLGLPELSALTDEERAAAGVVEAHAIHIGAIVPGTPAEKGGLHSGDIIVGFSGKPLDGRLPSDVLPQWLYHQILIQDPSGSVTLSIFNPVSKTINDIAIKLEDEPMGPSAAKRAWSDYFGFGARELVLLDRYALKVMPEQHGVIITAIKPNSRTGTALLRGGDLLVSVNGHSIRDTAEFEAYSAEREKVHTQDAISMTLFRQGREVELKIVP
jgi:S1-C subfamily serine protease